VIARVRSFVFSLQTKLALAFASMILLTIFLSGAVFIFTTRDERRQQALDRVASASPAIYQQAFLALVEDRTEDETFADTLDELASEQDTRILILAPQGIVLYDTGHRLDGLRLELPNSRQDDIERGFLAWEPPGSVEENVTFVAPASRFVTQGGRRVPFNVVLAVESDTIADAWRGVLPGLLLASAVAVPLAMLAAVLLSRTVAQPVRRLTAASEAIARGDFDQRIRLDREDEIGRLARSFTAMAERVGERDQQMRALLANVSHDLKTPMTSITGYAQSLADGTAGPDDVERVAGVIRSEAEHVNQLLADLLFLGEIDAGQVVTRREDVPLSALVERCARRIEPLARAREITVESRIAEDAVLHDVDAEKLERALTNVLDNAVKFTPSHGSIAVVGQSVNGVAPPRVEASITNTGSTIPSDDLPHVFERFFRGDRARRTAGGSGLGLAIARELVELNGGRISAASTPDSVTFTLAFPALPS
jgi:signal transduction histidine kinase